ncbi:MAG TPA: hypothetical protein V6D47_18265 [Oscillatoriaceae cyanobacterium]
MATQHLFVPNLYADDLEAEGTPPSTAAMKVNERKKDIRRVEAALEGLGVPFKHERVGTSATLTEDEAQQLLALLPRSLPSRCDLELQAVE